MTGTNQQWDIVSSVGLTALAVAAGRSLETHRDDGLVDDPFAEEFVQAAAPPVPMPTRSVRSETGDEDAAQLWGQLADQMGVRSRFFDHFFQHAAQAGVTQAVVLASGLDTRAFRLDWPEGFRLFEIDQPQVLEFKDQVLDRSGAQPLCERHCVRVDLRDEWDSALAGAGFDPSQPTAWLAEGLLPYLPQEAEHRLLTMIHQVSAPGSYLAVEHPRRSLWHQATRWFPLMSRCFGVDMRSLLHEDDRPEPDITLAALGWTATLDTVRDVADRYQRPLSALAQDFAPHSRFITAHLPR